MGDLANPRLAAAAEPPATFAGGIASRTASWPLWAALYAYLFALRQGARGLLLIDGDTYWHIATGRWILEHGRVPTTDPFSHTLPGAPWTAHEWLSDVALALVHGAAGWGGIAALTAAAFGAAIGLLTRFLLNEMAPARALLLAALGVLMTGDHLLARPHILAMPLMMLWMAGLVGARDRERAPPLWLLPVMALWANMHGGFTLGIAFAAALAGEALLGARAVSPLRLRRVGTQWGVFLLLAVGAALLTPHGVQAFLFTWQVMTQLGHTLQQIGEWRSPDFHRFQPVMLWLLAGMGLVLLQGLRLPPVRTVLLLGLVYLALKHARNVELLGLVGPLLVARSFGAQWRRQQAGPAPAGLLEGLSRRFCAPATRAQVAVFAAVVLAAPLVLHQLRPAAPPEAVAPVAALAAAEAAGAKGPVLNAYRWGGWLIYRGTAPFVDGRADMYGDQFMRDYHRVVHQTEPGTLQPLLDRYRITWTVFPPTAPVVAELDRLPQWERIHSGDAAVVHLLRAQEPAAAAPKP